MAILVRGRSAVRILVFGGTRFSGAWFVRAAVARGHALTLVHRGRSAGAAVDGVEHVVVERDSPEARDALRGRSFDAVVDFSGFVPRVVRESYGVLGEIGHVSFVSSLSAYAEHAVPGRDEADALASPPPPEVEVVDGETYGGLKVACEREVVAAVGDRCHLVRPGLIVGPLDPTDRFTWWPVRVARGGRALAPAPRETLVQVVDARDLADFLLVSAEEGHTGASNAVCDPVPMGAVLDACIDAVGPDAAEVVWADGAWLEERGVQPWAELPLWVGTDPGYAGFGSRSNARARALGLSPRPLGETVADTLAWARTARTTPRTGLDPAREAALVAEWEAMPPTS
jgi:2'-hydroxyisoflavone reductase